jgi:hypothetical protein
MRLRIRLCEQTGFVENFDGFLLHQFSSSSYSNNNIIMCVLVVYRGRVCGSVVLVGRQY